ncbi:hypothetical protein NIES970_09010 [[Synechococcus] sp. NIES-970]|nr:hypothetical protein NIES970_09010 [[Synechococcus] sp. NIES-970]
MCLLSNKDIEEILCPAKPNGEDEISKLSIYPFSKESLGALGYDLRVGNEWLSLKTGKKKDINKDCPCVIEPGDTANILTLEHIKMPENCSLAGLITSRVTLVSKGLSHISTNVDPDWDGELLIAIHNHSSQAVTIGYEERLCTVSFLKNANPATIKIRKAPKRTDVTDSISQKKIAELEKGLEQEGKRQKKIDDRSMRAAWLAKILVITVSIFLAYLVSSINSKNSDKNVSDEAIVGIGALIISVIPDRILKKQITKWTKSQDYE